MTQSRCSLSRSHSVAILGTNFLRRFFAFTLVVLTSGSSLAAIYTVGPGAGTSAATLTALLAARTLQPGDIVEFQAATPGGSATFNETWIPNGSGTAANPIIIRARPGDVITNDRQDAANNAISLSSVSNIVIDGFVLTHTNQAVIVINGGGGITIQNCHITNDLTGTPGSVDKTGITAVNNPNGLNILNNVITTGEGSLNAQTDSMIIGGSNVVIRGNTCIMHNADTHGNHNDCIQTLNITNLTVEGNYVDRNVNTTSTQGQGIYVEWYNTNDANVTNYGTCVIRNNVVMGNGGSFLIQTNVRNSVGQTKAAIVAFQIYNNTVDALNYPSSLPFRAAYSGTWVDGSMDFKNNILIARRTSGLALVATFDPPYANGKFVCDYNHYFPVAATASTTVLSKVGTLYTWASWQIAGLDTHGIGNSAGVWKDPLFVSQATGDYRLSSISPDVGVGSNLSAFFTTDLSGATRFTWDVGAYASGSGPIVVGPSNARVGITVQ
jgi:hypothetical protein